MTKLKQLNKIDKNGETIMASQEVDLVDIDLSSMTDQPSLNKDQDNNISSAVKVKLQLENKTTNQIYDYEGNLKEIKSFKNKQLLKFFMSIDNALELIELNTFQNEYKIKSLELQYVQPISLRLKKEKTKNDLFIQSISLNTIKNSVALVELCVEKNIFSDIDQQLQQIYNNNKINIPLPAPSPLPPAQKINPYMPQKPWQINPNEWIQRYGEKNNNWSISYGSSDIQIDNTCYKSDKQNK